MTIDTLRPDHMSAYGYHRGTTPNVDRWFEDGARYERCYSTDANTPPSVVSILSGLYPDEHGVRLFCQLIPKDRTLLTQLLPAPYQTAGIVSNVVLVDESIGLGRYFDHYDDFVDEPEPFRVNYERGAKRTTDAALEWFENLRDPERPSFLWVHYIDPHGPYLPPPRWERRFDVSPHVPIDTLRVPEYIRLPGLENGSEYIDLYDEEIAYMDQEVGRLLDGISRSVDLDEAYVVFTADHGEAMMEHERWFTHGYAVYDEVVRVPLLIRGPGIGPRVSQELTSGVDVAPTLLAAAGVSDQGMGSGRNLLEGPGPRDGSAEGDDPAMDAAPDRIIYTEAVLDSLQIRAAVQGDRKWMAAVGRGTRTVQGTRFYDLASDPGELRASAWPSGSSVGSTLLARIGADPDPGGLPERYKIGVTLDGPKVASGIDSETREKLRSLGYIK